MTMPRAVPPLTLALALPAAFALLASGRTLPLLGLAATAACCLVAPRGVALALVPVSMAAACVPSAELPPATAAAATGVLLALLVVPRAPSLRAHGLIVLLGALLAAAFLFPAEGFRAAPRELLLPLAGLGLLAATVTAPPPSRLLLRALALGGCAAAALALLLGVRVNGGRLAVGELNPNYLGAVLVPAVVAGAALAWRHRNPLWLAPAAVAGAALAATESRGAVLAAAAGLGFLCLTGRRARVLLGLGCAAAFLLLPSDDLLNLGAGDRDAGSLTHNTGLRTALLRMALQTSLDHPLRGLGLGGFGPHAASSPEVGLFLVTHNDYLHLSSEAGFPALAVLLLLLWQGLRAPGDPALRAVLAGLAAHMVFIDSLHQPAISSAFFVVLGTLLAARRNHVSLPRPRSA